MITHILHEGKTFCNFGYGMFPGEWPNGHAWTHLHDAATADCPECIKGAKEYFSRQGAPESDMPDTSGTGDR